MPLDKTTSKNKILMAKVLVFFQTFFLLHFNWGLQHVGFQVVPGNSGNLRNSHNVVLSTEYIKSHAVCHPLSPNFEVRNHPTGWRCCCSLGSGSTDCLEVFFCRFAFELTQAVLGALNDNRRFSVAGQKVAGDACLLRAHVENRHNMCKIDRLTLSYRDDDRDVQELVRLGMLTFDVLLQVQWSGYVMVLGCFCICLPDIVGDS